MAMLPATLGGALQTADVFPRLLGTLRGTYDVYAREVWPAREVELRARIRWWEREIEPRLPAAFEFLERSLGLTVPATPVRVVLVPEMDAPGAAT